MANKDERGTVKRRAGTQTSKKHVVTHDDKVQKAIEANPRKALSKLLRMTRAPAPFAVGDDCSGLKSCAVFALPGLTVKGIGSIGLPLGRHDERALAKLTRRKGNRLDPDCFEITNLSWDKAVDDLLLRVEQELGIGQSGVVEVEAQLCSLILCHQGVSTNVDGDSSGKVGDLFGKLVITLPSVFEGGELVVTHGNTRTTISQSQQAHIKTQYAAFYNNDDCQYKFEEVTSGRRLCLVYNLVKVGGRNPTPKPSQIESLPHIKAAVSAWGDQYDGYKIVLMMNRYERYSEEELLHRMEQEGVELAWDYATVSCTRQVTCRDQDDDNYSDVGGSEYTTWDIKSEEYTLDSAASGLLPLWVEHELVPSHFFDDCAPTKETYEDKGYDCIQLKRQYEEKALVVWPRSKTWVVLADGEIEKMKASLLQSVDLGVQTASDYKAKAFSICNCLFDDHQYRCTKDDVVRRAIYHIFRLGKSGPVEESQ